MRKGSPITIYLEDEALAQLDREVARRAQIDRDNGLAGYSVANRSKVTSEIITDYIINLEQGPITFEKIRQIVVPVFEKYGVKRADLFGSFARGEQTPESDVDIIVDKGQVSGVRFFALQNELSEKLGRAVDLQAYGPGCEEFTEKIAADLKELYAS